MRRDFDVFERFPDGSTLWRCCVHGRYEAQRKMHEMAEHSGNEFFLIDIQAEVLVLSISTQKTSRALIQRAAAV